MPVEPSMTMPTPPAARQGKARGLPIFLLALFIGVAGHAVALALFRVSFGPTQTITPPPPYVHIVKYREADPNDTRQRLAKLFDNEMLYVPTQYNYGARDLKEPTVEPSPVFIPYPANVTLHDEGFQANPSAADKPQAPTDALKPQEWTVLGALGQAASTTKPLATRGALLRIAYLAPLANNAARPPGESIINTVTWPKSKTPPDARWIPASYLVVFDATGLVGDPAIENSSGFNTTDAYFQAELRAWFTRHPLRPGIYRIDVGP